jgi:hypothetical protein
MAKADPRSITRRSLFAALALPAAAILPATAVPLLASAATRDPIFALIEAHKRAYAEFIAVLDDLAVAEQAAWHAPRGKRRAAKAALRQAYAAERHFGELESDAMEHLLASVPQTLDGLVAALRYVRDWFEQGHSLEEEDYITLIASVERAICPAAG